MTDPLSSPATSEFAAQDFPSIPGVTLLRPIGRGYTARVFAGKVEGLSGQYAIKVPNPETLADHAAAERFANEVRLSMQFNHPNLVRGVSGVAFGAGAYLAMPRYREGTLGDQQEAGRTFSTAETLAILADIAAGVCYLHQQGGVHQDIKPHNVYLGGEKTGGAAALGDFGSTYLAGGKRSVSGSPFYMSPEIYHGEASSSASDVYSFGVMSYELLAGKRPFVGSSYEELMVAHLTQFAAPLGAQNPEVPRPLVRLIEQSMSKQAYERPSAAALLEALQQVTQPAPAAEPEPAPEAPKLGRASLQEAAPPAPEPTPESVEPLSEDTPEGKKGLLSRFLKRKG